MRGVKTVAKRVAVTTALVVLLVGCAAPSYIQGLFVSGVSLEVVGNQFAQVSTQITAGCAQKVILPATCEKYRVFGEHFKKTYPIVVGMWRAAREAEDAESKKRAEDVIRLMSEELSKLAIEALGAFAPEIR